jgi:hypothetical protein
MVAKTGPASLAKQIKLALKFATSYSQAWGPAAGEAILF